MKPSPKLLWLCLLAICAFGAVAASSASAAVDHFTCASAPCTLTGEVEVTEPHTFGTKASALSTTCNKATLHGTVSSVSVTAVTVHPEYSECAALGTSATIDTEGCNYIFTGETDAYKNTSGIAEVEDATFDIECEGTSKIKLTVPGCTLTFPTQERLLGVKYTNKIEEDGTRDATIDVTLDKIKYSGVGILCPAAVKGEHEDGFLTQKFTVKGYTDNESARVGVEVS